MENILKNNQMESLSEKLKSLGMNIGVKHLSVPEHKYKEYPIEEIIQGFEHNTYYGKTFITKLNYPNNYQHGSIHLDGEIELGLIGQWLKPPQLGIIDLEKIIFLDTETSGLVGGTGTFVFMIGIGYFKNNVFHIKQLFLRSPDSEKALIASLDQFLCSFKVIVTYNGKSFDVPMINTRYVINGFESPLESYIHIDLLHLARKLWRNRIPNRSLGYVEQEILGFTRTQDEVPGWMVPQIYLDYLHSSDARPLKSVFYHNAMDVLSLAGLLKHISNLFSPSSNINEIHSLDLISIARLYEELGNVDEAASLYEQSINKGLPKLFFLETINRYAQMQRRQGKWEAAIKLWKNAAECNEFNACIELAKYFEHQERDIHQAIYWTKCGVEQLADSKLNVVEKKGIIKEINHRLERLERKMDKGNIDLLANNQYEGL